MKKHRVVITGIGVVAPNAIGIKEYEKALRQGKSGIKHWEELERLNIRCQIGGAPDLSTIDLNKCLPRLYASKITNKGIIYGLLSGLEAWKDSGFEVSGQNTDYDSGIVFGAGDLSGDSHTIEIVQYKIDRGDGRKLGSRSISEYMNSGAAAYLNSILGLGNRVQSNSSACITGTEAVLIGYEHLAMGRAKRMLCGSTEGDGRYIWGSFDAMRVLCVNSNEHPELGSRPMSATSSGFVPAGGSGAMVLETLESAQERGAHIYAEILGGHVNSGGQRNGGSMTAANSEGVVKCIQQAISNSGIEPHEIDLINGHLTSTKGDPVEIRNWSKALGLSGANFPLINTPKSMIGHAIGGAGSLELVASIIQMENDFVHANLNVDQIHPEILDVLHEKSIPRDCLSRKINTLVKANFGFGDLNCMLVLRKFAHND